MQWFIHEMYHCLSNIQIFWSCFNIYQNSRQHVLTTLLLDLGLCVREIEKGVRFGINFFVTFALWPQHWMCSVNEQCVIIDISWFFQPPWSIFPVTHGENTFMYVCMKRSHKSSIVSSPGFLLLALPGADMWEKYHSYLNKKRKFFAPLCNVQVLIKFSRSTGWQGN